MQRKWWTLLAVSVATFMLLLDITVVNVALPSIRADLGASFTDLQWVIDAYALTLGALVLAAGSLADHLGRRRVFGAGLAIFSLASLLCALAPDPTFLSLARALQGVGGAVMFAVSLALIAQEFPAGRERGTAMGMYGATIGIAVAIGPLVGGALTDSLGWESIFYLNVPIGLAAIAITVLRLRESRDPNATRADWPGVATFSAALFVLVLALLRGNDEGWGSALIVSLLAGAGALLVAFVAVERRVAEPMLPLALFRRRAFTGMQIAAVAISGSIFALFLYLTLYLQNYLGLSPLQPAHERHRRRLGLDDAARRLPRRRRRHGPAQPGHRRRGRERRARRAGRHGGRDQQHVPPGRGRRRHRRVGRSSSGGAPTRSPSSRRGRRPPPATGRANWSRPPRRATSTRPSPRSRRARARRSPTRPARPS